VKYLLKEDTNQLLGQNMLVMRLNSVDVLDVGQLKCSTSFLQ